MNSVTQIFLGFIFTVLTFFICLFLVVGVKIFYLTLKAKFPLVRKPKPQETPSPAPPKKRRRFKSIEINPDEIDRIIVRK